MKYPIHGTYTALITPFNADGSVDKGALRAIVDQQIKAGVQGLVPVGTTGESPTLNHKENIEVVQMVFEQAAGRVSVIAGTGSNSTSEAVEMTKLAKDVGVQASLQVAPYYNKPTQEGFYRHYMTIAEEGGLPVVVYNIPGRSGRNIEVETIVRLAAHQNIVAVKEANTSIAHVMKLMQNVPKDISILSGNDEASFLLAMLGAHGVISVASNIAPKMITKLMQAALNNDVLTAREWHFRLLPLFDVLFLETNPIPVKYAMHAYGFCKEVYRLPLCPLDDGIKASVDRVLSALKPE